MRIYLTFDTGRNILAITSEADKNGKSETVDLRDLQASAQHRPTALSMQHLHDMGCEDTFAELDKRGILREAVEGLLLNIVYANHSSAFFAVIELADSLRNDPRIRDIEEITIALHKQGESLSRMLESELKTQFPQIKVSNAARHKQRLVFPIVNFLQSYFCLLSGIVITGIGILLSILKREDFGRKQDIQITPETFVLFPIWRNDTKHAWNYLYQTAAETHSSPTIFLTGNPITKQPPRKVPVEMDVKVRAYRAWSPADYGDMCSVLWKSWSTIWALLTTVFEDAQSRLSDRIKWGTKSSYLLSAALHRRMWVERSTFSGTGVIVFGYSPQTSPDIMFDLALQKKGFTTIHWLHGVVAAILSYRGYSSVCLCRTAADAEEMRKLETYGRCEVGQFGDASRRQVPDTAALMAGAAGTLVITNFIHPQSFYSDDEALRYLYALLEMVAGAAFSHESMAPLIWRPHPHSNHSRLRKLMIQATEKAKELGFKLDNGSALASQIKRSRFLICTYSSTFIDVVESGFVPALFTLSPTEDVSIWNVIPDELKFDDKEGLIEVLSFLEDHHSVTETHRRLVEKLNVTSQTVPSPGYFQHRFR
jgi:hypothetical protein